MRPSGVSTSAQLMLISPLGFLHREGGFHGRSRPIAGNAAFASRPVDAFVHAVQGVETGSSRTGSSTGIFQSSFRR